MTLLIHGHMRAVRTMNVSNIFKKIDQIYMKLPKIEIIAKVIFHFLRMFCLHKLVLTLRIKC